MHQRLRRTTVYVTHDQIEAMTMADKIVVMHDGIVEQVGAPLELYDRPANQFVAGFIGSPAMNFVKGRVTDGHVQADGGFMLPLPPATPEALAGRLVVGGIRPEHFGLSDQASGGIPVQVVVVEPTGSETQVVVRGLGSDGGAAPASGPEMVCLFRDRIAARPGETIFIAPEVSKIHLFEAESGARLGGTH